MLSPFKSDSSITPIEYLAKAFHGTTTVGLIASEAVILAADKRATAGNVIASRRAKKIIKITDYAAMTISGLVADAQALADTLRENARYYEISNNRRMPIIGFATLLSNILFSSRWFPYIVQLIVGGYDVKPRLFVLDPYGSITEEEEYTATGSGSPIALGLLESKYKRELDIEEGIKLAVSAVKAAIARDSASGDGVDVAIITKKGYEERHIPL
jgi:proteasome beta subunit